MHLHLNINSYDMKHQILFVVVCCMLFMNDGYAQQEQDKLAVQKVIAQLFKGMQLGDSVMVHAVFAKEATGATAFRDKENKPVLSIENSFADFFKAIGSPHKETWYEEIWNLEIKIDDDLAQCWCQYAFYLDNKYSHCGVDAFYLHKEDSEWKIFYLVDTRRKDNCLIPQGIIDKHKE